MDAGVDLAATGAGVGMGTVGASCWVRGKTAGPAAGLLWAGVWRFVVGNGPGVRRSRSIDWKIEWIGLPPKAVRV